MISDVCAVAADTAQEYREAATEHIRRPRSRWLMKRLGWCAGLHGQCAEVGCTCQCRIPELEGRKS